MFKQHYSNSAHNRISQTGADYSALLSQTGHMPHYMAKYCSVPIKHSAIQLIWIGTGGMQIWTHVPYVEYLPPQYMSYNAVQNATAL